MNSRERVLATLKHQEPDQIPFDLGGAPNTGMHINAYKNLLKYRGDNRNADVYDIIFQIASIDEDILKNLKVDFRGLDFAQFGSLAIEGQLEEDEKYLFFTDDWGIKWIKPKVNGLYFDMKIHPLAGRIDADQVDSLNVPRMPNDKEIDIFKKKAEIYKKNNLAVVMAGPDGGILEHAFAIRGHADFMIDLISETNLAKKLLDRILTFKLQYWELILKELGSLVDVISEGDDMATQENLILNPALYRKIIKPFHRELLDYMKKNKRPSVFINFHSCGAVKELIPDLIEMGIDSLHPVQVSAAGMDTKKLKKEFGKDLTFWGGGVDTQHILSRGTPSEVREEVKRRIEDLSPGGGFIFAAVHNIQADVQPENFIAMWKTLNEYRKGGG